MLNRKIIVGACLGVAGAVIVAAGGFGPMWQPEKKPVAPAPAVKPAQPAKPDAKAPAKPEAKQPEVAPEAGGMDDMAPGPAHKEMAKMVGDWETGTAFSMGGQAMPATKGTAKISMMLDGRFLKEEASGEMMGQPYTSFKTIGYNNGTKQYEGLWLYTMSTAMMTMTGTSTDDGKTVTYTAKVAETAGHAEEMTIVKKSVDDNTFTVTMTAKGDAGGGDMTMEVKYTRKK